MMQPVAVPREQIRNQERKDRYAPHAEPRRQVEPASTGQVLICEVQRSKTRAQQRDDQRCGEDEPHRVLGQRAVRESVVALRRPEQLQHRQANEKNPVGGVQNDLAPAVPRSTRERRDRVDMPRVRNLWCGGPRRAHQGRHLLVLTTTDTPRIGMTDHYNGEPERDRESGAQARAESCWLRDVARRDEHATAHARSLQASTRGCLRPIRVIGDTRPRAVRNVCRSCESEDVRTAEKLDVATLHALRTRMCDRENRPPRLYASPPCASPAFRPDAQAATVDWNDRRSCTNLTP